MKVLTNSNRSRLASISIYLFEFGKILDKSTKKIVDCTTYWFLYIFSIPYYYKDCWIPSYLLPFAILCQSYGQVPEYESTSCGGIEIPLGLAWIGRCWSLGTPARSGSSNAKTKIIHILRFSFSKVTCMCYVWLRHPVICIHAFLKEARSLTHWAHMFNPDFTPF